MLATSPLAGVSPSVSISPKNDHPLRMAPPRTQFPIADEACLTILIPVSIFLHVTTSTEPSEHSTGDELLRTLSALASAPRLRIIAAIMEDRTHVSQLARDLGMSRPLVHLHLNRLEAAGLVQGQLELSSDGKAMKF